jgi:hypothetical protein
MCIPIFLQGDDRLAARASLWIFHEAVQRQANGQQRTDMAETWRLFRKYYLPAGVSMNWLKSIVPLIKEANLWQTGGDLISAKTGLIMQYAGRQNRAGRGGSGNRCCVLRQESCGGSSGKAIDNVRIKYVPAFGALIPPRRISCAASQRDWRNKAIAAPRDIDNEPISITSVTQRAAQCRNMDSKVCRLHKCVRPNPSH